MSLRCGLPTESARRGLLEKMSCQKGAFSPFLFGMILGTTIFSAVAMYSARQQLAAYQQRQLEKARKDAEDVAKGLEFSIASETKDTYRDDYNLDRARAFSSSTGKTRGQKDYQVTAVTDGTNTTFGQRADRVAITATDDPRLRNRVRNIGGAADVDDLAATAYPVAVYDTSLARDSQIRTSRMRMEQMAEQLYAYYSAELKFPSHAGFEKLVADFPLRDAWGEAFDYDVAADGQSGQLSFTTPWNYTNTLYLSLKDGTESAK